MGLKLAPIFSNGMVLQRNVKNCIYGRDDLAKRVKLFFEKEEYIANVDKNGEFEIYLPAVNEAGPFSITIEGSTTITITDVLFGDVYLLAGQSNMELPIRRVLDVSGEEIKGTSEPTIRQYILPATFKFSGPEKYMVTSLWKKAEGEELMDFSATGYFFAKEIKENLKAPVGLIAAAVGGSTIEAWMDKESVEYYQRDKDLVEEFYDLQRFESFKAKEQAAVEEWLSNTQDNVELKKVMEEYSQWKTCELPALVTDYDSSPFYGSVYLCKEIVLDNEQIDEAEIYMGTIIDSDQIWINGILVGRTEYRYPPRKYKIPRGILKKGKNLITIRIVINKGNGGFIKGRPYYLHYNNEKIDLKGIWYYKVGKRVEVPMPDTLFPPCLSTGLYHTAIAPLSKMQIKGILWYQGESNTYDPKQYAEKFAKMLDTWRKLFGWKVPCIYVQLPNYRDPLSDTEDTGWASLRWEQFKCLSLPQVAMAVGIDLGEYNDLHPQNKKEIGVRMALAARHLIYGENIAFSGPIPKNIEIIDREVHIEFKYLDDSYKDVKVDNGKSKEINHFEIAGEDKVFYKAKAIQVGNKVMLSCDKVLNPKHVRYAWCDNPEKINFYNEAGLPAPGFSLDLDLQMSDFNSNND